MYGRKSTLSWDVNLDHHILSGETSKQVKQKVTERRLLVGDLGEEVEYRFSVRAVTLGAGPAGEARARTGPQPGSPATPRQLALAPLPAALHLAWANAASGRGPLLGYYIEAKKKGIRRAPTISIDTVDFTTLIRV